MSLQRRIAAASNDVGSTGGYQGDADDLPHLPDLVEFLAAVKYPDGGMRVPGSLTLFVEAGRLKVCLNDKDQGLTGFVTVNALVTLLDEVEGVLSKDGVDWRLSRDRRPKK